MLQLTTTILQCPSELSNELISLRSNWQVLSNYILVLLRCAGTTLQSATRLEQNTATRLKLWGVGDWLLAIGYWRLAIGYGLLVMGYWLWAGVCGVPLSVPFASSSAKGSVLTQMPSADAGAVRSSAGQNLRRVRRTLRFDHREINSVNSSKNIVNSTVGR